MEPNAAAVDPLSLADDDDDDWPSAAFTSLSHFLSLPHSLPIDLVAFPSPSFLL